MQDLYFFQATLRPDIRIRIRSRIIRIRIDEPRIRVIIRITAEQNATTKDNPLNISFLKGGAALLPPYLLKFRPFTPSCGKG